MTFHIVICPSCGTGNRVPADKTGKAGFCGNCQASLPPLYTRPQLLTGSTFDSFVATYPGPILAEFWAPW